MEHPGYITNIIGFLHSVYNIENSQYCIHNILASATDYTPKKNEKVSYKRIFCFDFVLSN